MASHDTKKELYRLCRMGSSDYCSSKTQEKALQEVVLTWIALYGGRLCLSRLDRGSHSLNAFLESFYDQKRSATCLMHGWTPVEWIYGVNGLGQSLGRALPKLGIT